MEGRRCQRALPPLRLRPWPLQHLAQPLRQREELGVPHAPPTPACAPQGLWSGGLGRQCMPPTRQGVLRLLLPLPLLVLLARAAVALRLLGPLLALPLGLPLGRSVRASLWRSLRGAPPLGASSTARAALRWLRLRTQGTASVSPPRSVPAPPSRDQARPRGRSKQAGAGSRRLAHRTGSQARHAKRKASPVKGRASQGKPSPAQAKEAMQPTPSS